MISKIKGVIGFNKFTVVIVLIYFLCGVGVTYAYFAFNYENSSVIVGNVIGINAKLDVELVVGNNDGLVPMYDDALSNAINAVGTTNGACIDSLGNLSCQVYKITLTNNGSKLQHLVGTIDWWYYNNIELKGYSSYLEDTVRCNDRTIYNKSGWEPNGGTNTGGYLYMSGYAKLKGYMDISFTCDRLVDSFTVSLENGNGDLDYPVGFLTVDEVISAGAVLNETNDSYYLYNEGSYWIGTPYFFDYTRARGVYVDYDDISNYRLDTSLGIRPSVSLKKGYSFTGVGDGSKDNPYVVA